MNKMFLMLATASMALATPALATNPNDPGPLPGCAPSGNTPPKCDPPVLTPPPVVNNGGTGGAGGNGGDGGAGGAGGNGVGIGVGVGIADARSTAIAGAVSGSVSGAVATAGEATATGGNATAVNSLNNRNDLNNVSVNENDNRSSAVSSNLNDNRSTATGGAGGVATAAGGAGGSAASTSGGNVLSNITNYRRAFRTAPMAYAPSMIAGECQRSVSFGISTPVGGISHGKTKANKFCELVKLRSVAADMSLSGQMQCAILAQDKRWARAMKASGETCVAPVITTPTPVITDTSVIEAGENG